MSMSLSGSAGVLVPESFLHKSLITQTCAPASYLAARLRPGTSQARELGLETIAPLGTQQCQ
jgi:hypothetical protein